MTQHKSCGTCLHAKLDMVVPPCNGCVRGGGFMDLWMPKRNPEAYKVVMALADALLLKLDDDASFMEYLRGKTFELMETEVLCGGAEVNLGFVVVDAGGGRCTSTSFSPCYVCTGASPLDFVKETKHINYRCILCGTIDPQKAVSQAWARGEPVWLIEKPLGTRLNEGPYETRAQAVDLAEAKGLGAVAVRLIKDHRDFLEIPTVVDGARVLGHGFHRSSDRSDTYEGPFPGLSYEVTVPLGSVDGVLELLRLAPPGEHVVEDIDETVTLWRLK